MRDVGNVFRPCRKKWAKLTKRRRAITAASRLWYVDVEDGAAAKARFCGLDGANSSAKRAGSSSDCISSVGDGSLAT